MYTRRLSFFLSRAGIVESGLLSSGRRAVAGNTTAFSFVVLRPAALRPPLLLLPLLLAHADTALARRHVVRLGRVVRLAGAPRVVRGALGAHGGNVLAAAPPVARRRRGGRGRKGLASRRRVEVEGGRIGEARRRGGGGGGRAAHQVILPQDEFCRAKASQLKCSRACCTARESRCGNRCVGRRRVERGEGGGGGGRGRGRGGAGRTAQVVGRHMAASLCKVKSRRESDKLTSPTRACPPSPPGPGDGSASLGLRGGPLSLSLLPPAEQSHCFTTTCTADANERPRSRATTRAPAAPPSPTRSSRAAGPAAAAAASDCGRRTCRRRRARRRAGRRGCAGRSRSCERAGARCQLERGGTRTTRSGRQLWTGRAHQVVLPQVSFCCAQR